MNFGTSLINKSSVETADTDDSVMLRVGGLLRWISISNLATVLASLIASAQKLAVKEVNAASYSVTANDRIVTIDASGNAVNLNVDPVLRYDSENATTPPLIVNRKAGSTFYVTITPTTGTINGASSLVIGSGGKTIYSDGANLHAI